MQKMTLSSDIQKVIESLAEHTKSLAGKTILITGGTGFLGRYFTETLATMNEGPLKSNPCKVIALDNLMTSKRPQTTGTNVQFVEHDIIKPWEPNERVDYIFHAAGIASPHYYREFPLETLDVAVNGTKNMLELARKQNAKIVFFSSSEIYGNPDLSAIPTPESYRGNVSCVGPRACYDESKRLGETLCMIYNQKYGVNTCVVRPFNVYGPGMQKLDYRVLPNFAAKMMEDQPIVVYGDGTQTRTFCYISDAVEGFLRVLLLGHPGETYNIGNPEPEVGMLELVRRIEKVLDRKVKFNLEDYPPSYPGDEPQRRCPDISKARSHLQYAPKVKLEDGLKLFFDWTKEAYA